MNYGQPAYWSKMVPGRSTVIDKKLSTNQGKTSTVPDRGLGIPRHDIERMTPNGLCGVPQKLAMFMEIIVP